MPLNRYLNSNAYYENTFKKCLQRTKFVSIMYKGPDSGSVSPQNP